MFSYFPGERLGRGGWGWKEMIKVGGKSEGKGERGKKKRVRVEDKCRVVRFLVDSKVRGGGCS